MASNSQALAKLQHWERMLRTAPVVMDTSSKKMAQATLVLIVDGFRRETDPYGLRWAPKQVSNGQPVLVGKTRRLRGGWRILRASRRGFQVRPSVDYATAHQDPRRRADGRLKRPRRMMVPSRRRGLPARWRTVYKSIGRAEFEKHFNT